MNTRTKIFRLRGFVSIRSLLLILAFGFLSDMALGLDLTAYEYQKAGNNRIVVY